MSVIRKVIPQCTFENATQVLKSARYIKTIEDIRGLAEAARVADAAQEKLYEIDVYKRQQSTWIPYGTPYISIASDVKQYMEVCHQ